MFDFLPDQGQHLRETREKWREVKDWKKWLTCPFLSIATMLRGVQIACFFFGLSMMGAAGMAGALADDMDAQEVVWVRANGDYHHTEKKCKSCACIAHLITIALFLVGAVLMLVAVVLWIVVWLMMFMSLLWLFSTDNEFELNHAIACGEINRKIAKIKEKRPKSADQKNIEEFNARQSKKIAALEEKLRVLNERHHEEAVRRNVDQPSNCYEQATSEAAKDLEDAFQNQIAARLIRVEQVVKASTIETYLEAEREVYPDKVSKMMQELKLSEKEVTAGLRSTIYQDFREDIDAIIDNAKREERIKIRMVANQISENRADSDAIQYWELLAQEGVMTTDGEVLPVATGVTTTAEGVVALPTVVDAAEAV